MWLTNASGSTVRTYDYDAFGNEKTPFATDTNPFRYSGEYYDAETGTYYLRARYYDPVTGRFTQEDPSRHGLNWYTYCVNNPVRYYDPSGEIPVETILDFASLGWSLRTFLSDPSIENAGMMVWDIGATFLPYIPGSYSAKGLSLLSKTGNIGDVASAFAKADNISDAAKAFKANSGDIVGSYKDIKKTVKSLRIKGMEVHHLIEKRFAGTLNKMDPNQMSSVAIYKATHKVITKLMRGKIPYDSIFKWSDELTTSTATAQQIWNALCETYTHKDVNMPKYIEVLKQDFIKAGFNLEWEQWKKCFEK